MAIAKFEKFMLTVKNLGANGAGMKDWLEKACAGRNKAELQRMLHERFPASWREGDRQRLTNMLKRGQKLTAEEMYQISEVTGYPVPAGLGDTSWSDSFRKVIENFRKLGVSDAEIMDRFFRLVPPAIIPASPDSPGNPYATQQGDVSSLVRKALEELFVSSRNG